MISLYHILSLSMRYEVSDGRWLWIHAERGGCVLLYADYVEGGGGVMEMEIYYIWDLGERVQMQRDRKVERREGMKREREISALVVL